MATILSFSTTVILAIERLGIKVSEQERDDYLHVWRLIAHLNGVTSEANPLQWGYEVSAHILFGFYRLYSLHSPHAILPNLPIQNSQSADVTNEKAMRDVAAKLAITIIEGAAKYFGPPLRVHVAISRITLGDDLSDQLRLPPSSSFMKARARFLCFVLFFLGTLAKLPWIGPVMVRSTQKRAPMFIAKKMKTLLK
jgi:hypothetical protein